MHGNFCFENHTKIVFGEDSLKELGQLLKKYSNKVLFVYGSGSIKKSGLYAKIIQILKDSKKEIVEDGGVMANPTIEKLKEGIKIARDNKIGFILAVGGGSVIDYAKALSVSINYDGDPWKHFFIDNQNPNDEDIIPVGAVVTMSGTGSEMNASSVITNYSENKKISRAFKPNVNPVFAILNPTFTYSVSRYQMVSGIYDSFNHVMEQYFSDSEDNSNDYLMEGMMRSIINSSYQALNNPTDYIARSNLMWCACFALNTFFRCGKKGDWKVHKIGHGICVKTNAPHGMTLSSISRAYYYYMIPYGLNQFVRFATNVFGVDPKDKSKEEIAYEGLNKLDDWMRILGVEMTVSNFGLSKESLKEIAHNVGYLQGGYKDLSEKEIETILLHSLYDVHKL